MTETPTPTVLDAEADATPESVAFLVAQHDLPWEERTIPHELHPGTRDGFVWRVYQKPLVRLMFTNGIDTRTVAAEGLHLVGDQLTYERHLRDSAGKLVTRVTGHDSDGPTLELVTRTMTVTVKR